MPTWRYVLAVAFCCAVSGALAQTAQYEDMNIIRVCPDSSPKSDCAAEIKRMSEDNKRAWKGDYQGQRNVSFCLSTGCDGLVAPNKSLGCAWRIVIIASGSPKVDASDAANFDAFCKRLPSTEASVARAQAGALFRAIYKREPPPVPW